MNDSNSKMTYDLAEEGAGSVHQQQPQVASWSASAEELLEPLSPRLLRFRLVSRATIDFGEDSGVLFRSAFGKSLREVACKSWRNACRTECRNPGQCAYSLLFESPATVALRRERGLTHVPHPLVLRISTGRLRRLPKGFMFTAEALLFGPARELVDLVHEAITETGRRGLGKSRAGFIVAHASLVDSDGEELVISYEGSPLRLNHLEDHPMLPGSQPVSLRHADLHFTTRTRLKRHGAIMSEVDFESLILSLVRRYSDLRAAWGLVGPPSWDVPQILRAARGIKTRASSLRFAGVGRWSSRQRKVLPAGGLVGRVTFEGDLVPFAGLLRVGELIHIGKGTMMGHGRYRLRLD